MWNFRVIITIGASHHELVPIYAKERCESSNCDAIVCRNWQLATGNRQLATTTRSLSIFVKWCVLFVEQRTTCWWCCCCSSHFCCTQKLRSFTENDTVEKNFHSRELPNDCKFSIISSFCQLVLLLRETPPLGSLFLRCWSCCFLLGRVLISDQQRRCSSF